MVEPATRVALLARPGAACDNLQAALRQAGADVVVVQDPGEGDPAAISAAQPGAVLVALEPAVEDALERYDAVLSQPGRLVIYDEVATAARREGWEAARWARHLAAKFGGHADVLPPGAGRDDAPVSDPRTPPPAEGTPATAGTMSVEPMQFDTDAVHLGIEPGSEEALASAGNGIDFGAFTPEMMAAMAIETPAPEDEAPEPARDTAGGESEPAAMPSLEWDTSSDVPAPASAALEAAAPEAPAQETPAPEAPATTRLTADDLSLVDIDADTKKTAGAAGAAGEAGEGGVIVLAGIGGPDAVRQFLGGLPNGFARPLLVRQRLDGGRHDRLVRQMQRATALPVELAEAGRALVAGHVYILPDGMSTVFADGATRFVASDAPVPVLAGLPAGDSAVLLLSGSDPATVPEVMEAARDGALVAGQAPEDSFDGAAAAALIAAGGESRAAADLAQRMSTRWLSLKD